MSLKTRLIRTLPLMTMVILFALGSSQLWAENVPTSQVKIPDLQDVPKKAIDALEEENKERSDEDAHHREYLSLMMGIEHDIEDMELPEGYKFQGDFEKFATPTYDPASKTLRFTPQGTGVGTVTIHDKTGKMLHEYRLDVKKSSLDKVARELRALIGDIEGIKLRVINSKIIIDGQILLPLDMSRIGLAASQFGDQVVSMVTVSPVARKKIAEIIEREINNPEVSVRAVNEKFLLEGIVDSQAAADRAVMLANIYLPDVVPDPVDGKYIKRIPNKFPVVNLLQIRNPPPAPPKKMVQVVVHYVELNKDYNKMFRFQWMPDLKDGSGMKFGQGQDSAAGVVSQITGIISNLFPKLNWLKSHNFARILETSNIMVESGSSGSLNSSTPVAFPSVTTSGQSKNDNTSVGIEASVTPSVSSNSDTVSLELKFTIKQLIGISDSGPMISQNTMNTVVSVRNGQSAAIGGLIRNFNFTDYNRLPADVSRNPIVSLFASKGFQRKQTQFVVFVTPVIKNSANEGVEKIKKKFRVQQNR